MTSIDKYTYAPKQVRELLNISQTNYSGWISRGFIRPTYPAARQGQGARFTQTDLIRAYIFTMLSEAGFSNKLASDVAYADWVKDAIDDGSNGLTVHINDHSYLHIDLDTIKEVLPLQAEEAN